MAISENPTGEEIAANLRRRAFMWALEYYNDDIAEHYAYWYAKVQPPLDFYKAFQLFMSEENIK